MLSNYGKKFEGQLRQDLSKIDGAFVYRLPDQQSGYVGTSQNPCDFLFYKKPFLYLLEAKSVHGNTFPISNLRQYGRLINFTNIDGLFCGVIVWFTEHDRILYVPIETFRDLIGSGAKSVNINKLEQLNEKFIDVPVSKKRIMCEGDYSFLEKGVIFND